MGGRYKLPGLPAAAIRALQIPAALVLLEAFLFGKCLAAMVALVVVKGHFGPPGPLWGSRSDDSWEETDGLVLESLGEQTTYHLAISTAVGCSPPTHRRMTNPTARQPRQNVAPALQVVVLL